MTALLVDQQLPEALAAHLTARGDDAQHIKDYLGGATMPDADISRLADAEGRVVTKDEDFRVSYLLRKSPARLLHVTCGNISTHDLLVMFDQHGDALQAAVADYRYLEIDRRGVVIHDRAERRLSRQLDR